LEPFAVDAMAAAHAESFAPTSIGAASTPLAALFDHFNRAQEERPHLSILTCCSRTGSLE
jgi:hypothetical protein